MSDNASKILKKMMLDFIPEKYMYAILEVTTNGTLCHSCFSDFIFKIILIRLGFSFQKQKFLYLN